MENKKSTKIKKGVLFALAISILIFAIVLSNTTNVKADSNACCEKLKTNADGTGGQWCQNAPVSACDTSINPKTGQAYQVAPTSCDSTNFCSAGTCYDSKAGICESGVTLTVCNGNNGVWSSSPPSALPQCQLGCCYLGNGAEFTTQVSCKAFSAQYGINTNFNPSITSEVACISSAGGDAKGACVYQTGAERTCKLTTKSDCNSFEGNNSLSGVQFYEGLLCSDENLHTNCGPSQQTMCVPGQDEVYFVDTCGNLANIYDSSKINDKNYWSQIIQKENSCGTGSGNINSKSCGNCDFSLSSTCKATQRSDSVKPDFGNNICKSVGCTYNGQSYLNGESWCGTPSGVPSVTDPNQNGSYLFNGKTATPDNSKTNLPGSIYEKLTCWNGEVTQTNCYDGRQKVCVQDQVVTPSGGIFRNANCEINQWQDCYSQTSQADCLNRDLRQCQWTDAGEYYALNSQYTGGKTGVCAPLNTPGFDFWNGTMNGDNICSQASIICPYKVSKSLAGGYSLDKGSECITSAEDRTIRASWVGEMTQRCVSIGDCGPKLNYLGQPGQMQTIAQKIFADNAVGDYVKSDGSIVELLNKPNVKFSQYFKI